MLSLLAEVLGEIVLFIARLLAESFFALLLNWLLRALVGVGRTVVLLAFWPLMLLMGWLRLWQRERMGPLVLWRAHGPRGLHRFGWQEAARATTYVLAPLLLVIKCLRQTAHYLLAVVLLLLAGAGIGLVVYFGSRQMFWRGA